jgi:hypothetical protein
MLWREYGRSMDAEPRAPTTNAREPPPPESSNALPACVRPAWRCRDFASSHPQPVTGLKQLPGEVEPANWPRIAETVRQLSPGPVGSAPPSLPVAGRPYVNVAAFRADLAHSANGAAPASRG